jgi:hypothetical protein
MGIYIIIAVVAVVILAGIIVFAVSCKSTSTPTPSYSSSPTQTAQSTLSSQTPPASQNPSTTTAIIPTATQLASPIPTQVIPPSPSPAVPASSNIIIDHTNWDWYNSQDPEISKGVTNLKIFFAHASVGDNILRGLSALHSSNSAKYPLMLKGSGDTPPSTTSKGTIYEYSRGNPGWALKISSFETYVKNGWKAPTVDLAMNKFCYVDPTADWPAYRDSMLALEAQYPGTKFVYWTMPIMTATDSNAVLRSQFNQKLRDWIASQNNKIFFDLADIEAWSPDGQQQTFTSQGQTYQKLYAEYTSDGGHLNDSGAKRAANALYSLFGKIGRSQ